MLFLLELALLTRTMQLYTHAAAPTGWLRHPRMRGGYGPTDDRLKVDRARARPSASSLRTTTCCRPTPTPPELIKDEAR
jgi:hypothetical protein